jgi:hypothetical protein
VTYSGKVRFEDAAERTPIVGLFDKDFNFGLLRGDRAGLTDANPLQAELHLEMDRRETFDLFRSPWWADLGSALADNEGAGRGLVDGHAAVALGLFGLDGVHEYVSELHPVYAMAILREPERQAGETWEVFARHSAMNEGACSRHPHPLQGMSDDTLKLDIPWHPNAMRAVVDSAVFPSPRAGALYVGMQMAENRLAAVFVLPTSTQMVDDESERSMIDGALFIRWMMKPNAPTIASEPLPPKATFVDKGEELMESVLARLSAAELRTLEVALAQERATPRSGLAELAGRVSGSQRATDAIVRAASLSAIHHSEWPRLAVFARDGQSMGPARADLARRDSMILRAVCKATALSAPEKAVCGATFK